MAVSRITREFKDINLSFKPHPVTKDLTSLRNENAIKRSVRNLVQTIPTERFFNSILGSQVRDSLFGFVDFGTASVIEREIVTTILNFEPRVDNLQVNVNPRPDQNEFEVNVLFDIIGPRVSNSRLLIHITSSKIMPFAKFSNLDFDQIRTQIKDYLRANSNFTDFDFEGSNFSVLIDTLAYNTYISAFNSNLVVNESFLDSATLRENVVSLARNIGYVPRSKTAARASILFQVQTNSSTPTLTLQPGLVCTGVDDDTNFVFSISESITSVVNNGIAQFGTSDSPIDVLEGTFLTNQFIVDGSLNQRFILDNGSIDSSSIVVYVKGSADPGLGKQFKLVDNIINVTSTSETYLIQEVQDERYELLFGDGIFGKKLENGAVITVQYVVTGGVEGNGPINICLRR